MIIETNFDLWEDKKNVPDFNAGIIVGLKYESPFPNTGPNLRMV